MKPFILFILLNLYFGLPAQWMQLGSDIDGEAADDLYGISVALSAGGDTLAIGGSANDATAINAGHVRVFAWNGVNWVQFGGDIDGDGAADAFGWRVALSSSGTRLAVSGIGDDDAGFNSGHVRVYEWNGASWAQMGSDINGEGLLDESGRSLSLSSNGTRVAIGAPGNDGIGTDAGHVRVYEWNGASWMQLGTDIDGESAGDLSGWSVSLSSTGSRVAIGADQNDGGGANSGHVRVYDWNGASWTPVGTDIDGEAAGDQSGFSVSLSDDGLRLAIGAIGNDGNGNNSGHVRIYDWNGVSCVQLGTDLAGESADDNSGQSVSFSSDGTRVAIGAMLNDGNGSNAGHVRISGWSGTSWIKYGIDIDGELSDDNSGQSVSLTSSGSRIAIGARWNDGTATDAGHARVYENFAILSVETSHYSVVSNNEDIEIYWTGINEQSGSYYVLKRVDMAGNNMIIAQIDAQPNSPNQYQIIDEEAPNGQYYYFLYIMNKNNEIINTQVGYVDHRIIDGIKIKSLGDNKYKVQSNDRVLKYSILSVTGEIVQSAHPLSIGDTNISLDHRLLAGSYFIIVSTEKGTKSFQVVKTK